MNEFLKSILSFFKSLRFRYSVVLLILTCLMFLVIFPSLLKNISETYWDLIMQVSNQLSMLLGFGLKTYFDQSEKDITIKNNN